MLVHSLGEVLGHLQTVAIAVTAFICGAGLVYFAECLFRVFRCMWRRNIEISDRCAWHACWGMVCISGLAFSFARANTISLVGYGQITSGAAFMIGSASMVMALGMAIWADTRQHSIHHRGLAAVLGALVLLSITFGVVGVLGAQ